jgi:hypothetical protein
MSYHGIRGCTGRLRRAQPAGGELFRGSLQRLRRRNARNAGCCFCGVARVDHDIEHHQHHDYHDYSTDHHVLDDSDDVNDPGQDDHDGCLFHVVVHHDYGGCVVDRRLDRPAVIYCRADDHRRWRI